MHKQSLIILGACGALLGGARPAMTQPGRADHVIVALVPHADSAGILASVVMRAHFAPRHVVLLAPEGNNANALAAAMRAAARVRNADTTDAADSIVVQIREAIPDGALTESERRLAPFYLARLAQAKRYEIQGFGRLPSIRINWKAERATPEAPRDTRPLVPSKGA